MNKMGFDTFEECMNSLTKVAKNGFRENPEDYEDEDEPKENKENITTNLEDGCYVLYEISTIDYKKIAKKIKSSNCTCSIAQAVIVRVDDGTGHTENDDCEDWRSNNGDEDEDEDEDDDKNTNNPFAMLDKAKSIALEAGLCE
jgi:hypothetical protein